MLLAAKSFPSEDRVSILICIPCLQYNHSMLEILLQGMGLKYP